MDRLHPTLQLKLLRWRDELAEARRAGPAAEAAAQSARINVFVTFTGDLQTLRDAGLNIHSVGRPTVIGDVALADVEEVAGVAGVADMAAAQPVRPLLDGSVPETRAHHLWAAATPYTGERVIVGIIDSGIDVFHDSFRTADRSKSRIISIWDQQLQAAAGEGPPTDFVYGVEFGREQINPALLYDIGHPGEATFRHIDSPKDKKERQKGHGTHVAGIAAGDGSGIDRCSSPNTYVGVAPKAELVVVRHASDETTVVEALRYIFAVATAQTMPCVVNMSFGWNLHAHDGDSYLEREIDQLLRDDNGDPLPGRVVVASAGNEADMRRHGRKKVVANGEAFFRFEIGSTLSLNRDVETDTLHIYYDAAAALDMTLSYVESGDIIQHLHGSAAATQPLAGVSVATTSQDSPGTVGKKLIIVQLKGSKEKPVPKGEWTIHLKEIAGHATAIDIWVDRDDEDLHPTFVGDDAVAFNTVAVPGTCRSVIAVGAYDFESGAEGARCSIADFSSLGLPAAELASPADMRPHIAAPGVRIKSSNSGTSRVDPCCPWCCDVKNVDMDGTSMSAPHVTGVVALMLQKNPTLTFEQVRTHLQATASVSDIPASQTPPIRSDNAGLGVHGQPGFVPIRQNHIWGSGRLNAEAAVNSVPLPSAPAPSPQPAPSPSPSPGPGPGPTPFVIEVPAFGGAAAIDRLRKWQEILGERPAWQLFAALISTHVDEVRGLIDRNRRVAVVWRRCGGPALVRRLYALPPSADARLPDDVDGMDVARLIERFSAVLDRYGGAMLRADLDRWGGLVRTLPGATLAELEARVLAEMRA